LQKLTEINLALGGGGAKGFVHLGVLEEVAAQGLMVKAIVGTSIGAIIGALFAHFSTTTHPKQLDAAQRVSELFLQEDFWRLADPSLLGLFRGGSLLKGNKIGDWLANILIKPDSVPPEHITFGDLNFELTITATDAYTGTCLILNREQEPTMFLHHAVRASMSIQFVFDEFVLQVGGRSTTCWDGGTTGNCRFDLADRLYSGRPTVASTLTYRGEVVSTQTGILTWYLRPLKVLNHSTSILLKSVESSLWSALPADLTP
jgi:predicted acylesterase/phospholipase RssA